MLNQRAAAAVDASVDETHVAAALVATTLENNIQCKGETSSSQ